MNENTQTRTYTVADLYTEAAKMVREEMFSLKKKPLTMEEDKKLNDLAKVISKSVLKEMKIS